MVGWGEWREGAVKEKGKGKEKVEEVEEFVGGLWGKKWKGCGKRKRKWGGEC